MLQQSLDNLDAMILEEKKRVALEFFNEAWNSAVEEGIEAKILAESAILAIFTQLADAEGPETVSGFVKALPQRDECGDFLPNRSVQ